MVSLGGMEINSKHFASNLTIYTPRFVPLVCSRLNFRMVSYPRGKSLECSYRWKYRKGKTGLGSSEGNNFVVSRRGHWEDPDDGSGNEYDDDSEREEQDEAEVNDLEFESDWEEVDDDATHVSIVNNLSASNCEEDLVKGNTCILVCNFCGFYLVIHEAFFFHSRFQVLYVYCCVMHFLCLHFLYVLAVMQ